MRDVLQRPNIVILALTARQLDIFAFAVDNQGASPYIFGKNGLQRGKQFARHKAFGSQPLPVQIEREFPVIVLVPREIGINQYLLDTPVGQQPVFERVCPGRQFVVVVAVEFHAVTSGKFGHVVTEPLIL